MPGWPLQLLDWRRRVAGIYGAVRAGGGHPAALDAFRAARDELFRSHPQSPLPPERRTGFAGLDYFPHRPDLRVEAALEHDPAAEPLVVRTGTGEPIRLLQLGRVRPALAGEPVALAVYWLEGYGGGLFLPFRDALAGRETYGGGRYLLDTVKGADLGASADGARLVLDFNYAYNPSCAYDPRWSCPLAPPENRLAVPVPAGERTLR
ncbi:MAG: uncharacterized protein QOK40_1280 [Miltoncostaeaceae bacterium]|nr:uncharacterized protein [Miltoncostaeaceae bacterium]